MATDSPFSAGPNKEPLSRVLLIDDEWESHDIFQRTLKRGGLSLHLDSAFGGDEGIAFMERYRRGMLAWPCSVFIDIKMPGANGFDVLDWANKNRVLGRAVFVMLSSSNEPNDVLKAFQLGVHHYVSKSSPPEVLCNLVRSSRRFERPEVSDPIFSDHRLNSPS